MTNYYAIDVANQRISEIRPLLERLRSDRDDVAEAQRELGEMRRSNGSDDHAKALAVLEAKVKARVRRMQQAVGTIEAWDITLRDIDAGLIDFPALANGRPIWLCWRLGETDIGWWHEMTEGFSGRRPLIELE
ncbi:MAG: DUF2203 domain-containing protein [Candidatus Limnocylindrales bacterium]